MSSTGTIASSVGKYEYTISKQATAQYKITSNSFNPFPNANYVVQLTTESTGTESTARIITASINTTRFMIVTYADGVMNDCGFHFSVIA